MNQIAIITPVPDVINTLITNSILRKAVERNAVKFSICTQRKVSSVASPETVYLPLIKRSAQSVSTGSGEGFCNPLLPEGEARSDSNIFEQS